VWLAIDIAILPYRYNPYMQRPEKRPDPAGDGTCEVFNDRGLCSQHYVIAGDNYRARRCTLFGTLAPSNANGSRRTMPRSHGSTAFGRAMF